APYQEASRAVTFAEQRRKRPMTESITMPRGGEEGAMNARMASSMAAGESTVSLARPTAQRGRHAGGPGGERQHGARAVLTAPGAWALLSTSIIARLPLAMLSLVLLVHTERVTGSFALAGLVTGSYTVGLGADAPVLGRLVDRCGQLAVLLTTAFASSVLLGA